MRTDDFDYNLPEELIAQEPAAVRDECRPVSYTHLDAVPMSDRAAAANEQAASETVSDCLLYTSRCV